MRDYDQAFYDGLHEGARRAARAIVPRVRELLPCDAVIDVGCGDGTWLSVFRENGASRVVGVDGPQVDASWLRIPRSDFVAHDLTRPLALPARFDLAISLETAEHLPPSCADGFVASLTALAPVVLFSAAVPHQGGTNHVNEQWPSYWVTLFARHGYLGIDCLRSEIWNDDRVAWWYRQNVLLFVHEASLPHFPELVLARARSPRQILALVHPIAYEWKHLARSS